MTDLKGTCMCGAVRWTASGPVTRSLVCHCEDCKRATASPVTAFVGLKRSETHWTGEINHYQSSPQTWRGFCPACGTRLYFKSDKWPEEIHIHAATLADPAAYQPDAQVFVGLRAHWLDDLGRLPKFHGFQADPEDGTENIKC